MNRNQEDMNPEDVGVEKKQYETPLLKEYGSVAELTRGDGSNIIADVLVASV